MKSYDVIKEVKIKMYEAKDGTIFDTEEECRRWEKSIDETRGNYIPKEGELAWFWSYQQPIRNEWHNVPILATYSFGGKNGKSYTVREFDRIFFTDCAKFEGELPPCK